MLRVWYNQIIDWLFLPSADPGSSELLSKVLEAVFLHELHTQSKVCPNAGV